MVSGTHPDYQYYAEDFITWIRMRENARLAIIGVCPWYIRGYPNEPGYEEGELVPHKVDMPCENRWSESYLRRRIARLYSIDDWLQEQEIGKTTMMTLTLSHGSLDSSLGPITIPFAFRVLGKHWQKIRRRISVDLPGIQFVSIYEPHLKGHYPGYPHLHVLYFGEIPEILQEHVKRLWSDKYKLGSYERGVTFSNTKEAIKSGRNYVMKYLWKQLTAGFTNPAVIVFNAVAWKERFRLFSISPGLNDYINNAWAERIRREYYSDEDLEENKPLPPVIHCKTVSYRPGYPESYHDVKVPRSGKWGNASPKKVREYQKRIALLEEARENIEHLFTGALHHFNL